MRQTSARQNGVHIRATGSSGEQIPHNSLPVCLRETKPGPVLEPDRDTGENLVPEQEDQVEKAEPRGGQCFAACGQHAGRPEPGHVCVEPRHFPPPDFPQLQLRECDLPRGWCCSAAVHRGALASIRAQRVCPADLFQPATLGEDRTATLTHRSFCT